MIVQALEFSFRKANILGDFSVEVVWVIQLISFENIRRAFIWISLGTKTSYHRHKGVSVG